MILKVLIFNGFWEKDSLPICKSYPRKLISIIMLWYILYYYVDFIMLA